MDLFSGGNASEALPPFVRVELPGEPHGWERAGARIARTQGGRQFISFYTKKATRNYEAALKQIAALAMRRKEIIDGPVAVRITATLSVPKSWSDKKRDAALTGAIHAIGRPDVDNYTKGALDALSKTVWKDDSRVVRCLVVKRYGERPSLLVEVYLM